MAGALAAEFSRDLGQHSEEFRWRNELRARVTSLVQELPVGCDQVCGVAVYRCLYQPPVAFVLQGYVLDRAPPHLDRPRLQLFKEGSYLARRAEALEPF